MLHLGKNSGASVFISREGAKRAASAIGRERSASVIPAVKREADRSTSIGFVVRYSDATGLIHFA